MRSHRRRRTEHRDSRAKVSAGDGWAAVDVDMAARPVASAFGQIRPTLLAVRTSGRRILAACPRLSTQRICSPQFLSGHHALAGMQCPDGAYSYRSREGLAGFPRWVTNLVRLCTPQICATRRISTARWCTRHGTYLMQGTKPRVVSVARCAAHFFRGLPPSTFLFPSSAVIIDRLAAHCPYVSLHGEYGSGCLKLSEK